VKPEFDAEELAFRDEVRAVLAEHVDRDSMQFFHGRGGSTRELYQALGERGWLALTWPAEHGGGERSHSYEFLLWDEVAYARAARPDLGPGIVAKTLIAHGTADQQARYLGGIASGTTGFCLGYSEPDVGSDLRNVRTRAVVTPGGYRVSGEKCWTSDAHNSRYLWLLCRAIDGSKSEDAVPRPSHTILIVPLDAPGVTITPIQTIDGHQLNQVFLDDVHVPAEDRVGQEGAAWMLIREALAVERHLQLMPGRLRRDLEDLRAWLEATGHDADPLAQAGMADLMTGLAEVEVSLLATLAEMGAGGTGVLPAARTKYRGSVLAQQIARTALDIGGPAAITHDAPFGFLWQQTFMETIAGGTSEILLGIVAREGLHLGASR
jgi:3-oxocholest-4-en-26-oyl-CoA dehydrogenase alpha subunit